MFDYRISKHPLFNEVCRTFAQRHNMGKLAERAGMNVQTLRNKLNPEQPHQLTASDIWSLTDLSEDSILVDGFLAQIHCLPCVPVNEFAKEKLPHYIMSATAEIGRVAAGAVADHGACAPWTRGNVEKTYQTGGELPGSEEPAALPNFENMSKKELCELTARLRLVKPKRRKGYKQEITEHQRLQLNAELLSRGMDASETEVDLLLRGGSLPSGAGLRLFYRNQRLQEDDKWRQWY